MNMQKNGTSASVLEGELKTLWTTSLRNAEIAALLGVSKNWMVSAARRLRLPKRPANLHATAQ